MIESAEIINVLDALSVAISLVLVAIGLTIIYGFMEVINLAHGIFWLLGGYLTVEVVEMTGNFWLAPLAIILVVGILGLSMEVITLRPSYDLGVMPQALITLGVYYIIRSITIIRWGRQSYLVDSPSLFGGTIEIMGATYPVYRLFVIITGTALIFLTWIFIRYTDVGLIVRASLLDREMARGLGHNISRLYTIVFVGSVILAAIAGMLVAPLQGVSSGGGLTVLIEVFAIVLIGGLGSYKGTVLAGLGVGTAFSV
jgi:branched-subunit amino acid ABC-type transport system permease component